MIRRLVNYLGVDPNLLGQLLGGLAFTISGRLIRQRKDMLERYGEYPDVWNVAQEVDCSFVHSRYQECGICVQPGHEFSALPWYLKERLEVARHMLHWPLPGFYRPAVKIYDRNATVYAVPVVRELMLLERWLQDRYWLFVVWLIDIGFLEEPYPGCYFNELRMPRAHNWDPQ